MLFGFSDDRKCIHSSNTVIEIVLKLAQLFVYFCDVVVKSYTGHIIVVNLIEEYSYKTNHINEVFEIHVLDTCNELAYKMLAPDVF